MMRIGIDGSSILPRRTGIGHYTSQLLVHLAQIDSQNHYVVLLNSLRHEVGPQPWMKRENFAVRRRRIPGPALLYAWKWFNWPTVDRLVGKMDLFHSPATYVPPQRSGASVTTVHDVYFLRDPGACDRLGGRYLKTILPRRLEQLEYIIAASQSTRDDLVELLGVMPERIRVVYEGVDGRFRPVEDTAQRQAGRARYGLPERYLLFVGTIEPRKNVPRLIEAYAAVRRERPDAPALVIVGGPGKDMPRVQRAVQSLGLSAWVVFAGYVQHDDLPAIYSGAELFLLPSLYEGFGLPVLEAMACGVPVVAGQTSSLRELVAGRGFLVDPSKPSEIAGGILRGLSERALRTEYIERGLALAREMTWERCARQTLAVFEESVGQYRERLAAQPRKR